MVLGTPDLPEAGKEGKRYRYGCDSGNNRCAAVLAQRLRAWTYDHVILIQIGTY